MALFKQKMRPIYHKHTGNTTSWGGCFTQPVYHQHSGSASSGGGCYGQPVYHQHTGSTSGGGGCYITPNGHIHTSSCSTKQEAYSAKCGGNVSAWSNSEGGAYDRCSSCGKRWTRGTGPSVCYQTVTKYRTVYTCGNPTNIWALGCGKTAGQTIDSYTRNCEKTEGVTIDSYSRNCGKTENVTIDSYVGSQIMTK